jgi:hypothetical protein
VRAATMPVGVTGEASSFLEPAGELLEPFMMPVAVRATSGIGGRAKRRRDEDVGVSRQSND